MFVYLLNCNGNSNTKLYGSTNEVGVCRTGVSSQARLLPVFARRRPSKSRETSGGGHGEAHTKRRLFHMTPRPVMRAPVAAAADALATNTDTTAADRKPRHHVISTPSARHRASSARHRASSLAAPVTSCRPKSPEDTFRSLRRHRGAL